MYYAILAILSLGAVCVALFIFLFIGGAIVGLGSLGKQALRVNGSTEDAVAQVPVSKAVARPASMAQPVKTETLVDAGAAYAPA